MSRIAQISRSSGGVPKLRVPEASVEANGIVGDEVAHPSIHGGPDRAVCMYSLELIEMLRAEGHSVEPGSLGENLTLAGVDWTLMTPGSRWKLGESLEVEVTRYTTPCTTIASCFENREFMRISHERHPGWSRVYARVLRQGVIREGDRIERTSPGSSEE
ncbi:MAG: MOSC domain-containing protein [Candidatus Hydrogenedentota bacterium]